jgi:PAS domain S-box-containing protein
MFNAINLKLPQKGFVLIAVPLLFEVIFVIVLSLQLAHADSLSLHEQHSKDIIAEAGRVHMIFSQLGTNLLESAVHPEDRDFSRYDALADQLRDQVAVLGTLVADNKEELAIVDRLKMVTEKGLSIMERMRESLAASNGTIAMLTMLPGLREQFRLISAELLPECKKLIELSQKEINREGPEAETKARNLVYMCVLVGVAINLVIASALAVYFSKAATNRSNVLLENTRRMANNLPLNQKLEGSDEFATIDRTFHEMAEALKEAMAKEKALTANAFDVICSIDKEMQFTRVNPAVETAWGYLPDQLIGRNLIELASEGSECRGWQSIKDVIECGSNGTVEMRIKRADGSHADSLWSISWSPSEGALFCVAHDITQRKELERLKQDFVNMVSHDLRSPLTGIQYTLDLIGMGVYGEIPADMQEAVTGANLNSKRLIRLINELLDLDKYESGKLELNRGDSSISEVIELALESVRPLTKRHSVNIVCEQTNLDIFADCDRLVQVLVNLLSNAIKFSPPGGTINLLVREAIDSVMIKVIDDGPGIPDEDKESIFERFRQLKPGATKPGSSGLGLAICRAIVEAHGGSIGVESEPGRGSSFWFSIPAPTDSFDANLSTGRPKTPNKAG